MIAGWPWPFRVAFFAVAVLLYYRYGKRLLFAACRNLAGRVPVDRRYSRSEVAGVLELAAAALSHVLVVVLLLRVTGLTIGDLHLWPVPWALLPLGVAIGVGEFALASFICRLAIDVSLTRASRAAAAAPQPGAAPASMAGWLTIARGGWLRHHLKTLEIIPVPVAALLTSVQVGSEEIVFRGIMVGSLRESGIVVALGCSCVLFVAMQVFFMANWRGAMFPVVGATIMGVVHGLLFWFAPFVLPLVIAHVVFFFVAVA